MNSDLHSLSKLVNISRSPSVNPKSKSWNASWESPIGNQSSLYDDISDKVIQISALIFYPNQF